MITQKQHQKAGSDSGFYVKSLLFVMDQESLQIEQLEVLEHQVVVPQKKCVKQAGSRNAHQTSMEPTHKVFKHSRFVCLHLESKQSYLETLHPTARVACTNCETAGFSMQDDVDGWWGLGLQLQH